MTYPSDLKYTNDHEWVRVSNGLATVGVTTYAATQLGDMVYVDMPAVGTAVTQGASAGALESVKAAADFYSPLSGSVSDRNEKLLDEPGTINTDPYGEGWFMVIQPSNLGELDTLMDAAAYDKFVQSL